MPKIALLILLSIFMHGCSNYPLPQDTTGSRTKDIVARIRCEARDAVRLSAIKEIDSYKNEVIFRDLTGKQLATRLLDHPEEFNNLGAPRFKNKVIDKAFEYFRKAQIAYEFTLDLNEANTQGIEFDLIRTFGRRVDTVGVGIKGERTRQVIRRFKIIDNFLMLATKIDSKYCAEPRPIDIVYPLEGQLKIADLIDSFIFINKDASIKGTPTGPAIREMGDTVVFSTRFTGNAGPNFALNPTQLYGFELSRFAVKNDNFRQDKHQVIITATLPDIKNFPYYPGINPVEFRTNDPRLIAADVSIQKVRKNNVEDAITSISNSLSRLPLGY